MIAPNWIAAELSFTGLRIWLMRDSEVIEAISKAGVTAARLSETLATQPNLPIIVADLTGQLGQSKPTRVPANAKLQAEAITVGTRQIHLAQGVQQPNPAGIMHGQTGYIAGILAALPQFDGVICILGAHSFWVRISAGEICYFQGYLTGDLLGHIGGTNLPENAAKQPEFISTLDDSLSRPHRAYGHLLNLRGEATAELAGALIGLELADAKSYWLGETVMVIGSPPLTSLYATALRHQGVTVHEADGDATLLAGLHSLRQTPTGTIH